MTKTKLNAFKKKNDGDEPVFDEDKGITYPKKSRSRGSKEGKKSGKGFNWKGIVDNGDGTFTVDGKVARKRLLKEYHKQGLQVRSHKESDGTYTLSAIGPSRKTGRSRAPVRSIGQVRTRSQGVRRQPSRSRAPVLMRGRFPQRRPFGGSPILHKRSSPNLLKALNTELNLWTKEMREKQVIKQQKQDERAKQKIERETTEAKMAKERKQAEQQELEKTIVNQRTHSRLLHERQAKEQQEILRRQQQQRNIRATAAGRTAPQIPRQADQADSLRESISRSDQRVEQRRTDRIIAHHQGERNVRNAARMTQGGYSGGSSSAPQIPRQEVTREQMDAARQRAATED